ncbi:MAG: hypothetical protein ABJF50_17180 [Paracoccaceae bacterium]
MMEEHREGPRLKGLKIPTSALLFALALAFAGPAIFLHELGHYVGGLAYGEEVRMTASSVISDTPTSSYPPVQRLVQTGLGPVVSVLLTLIGIALLNRHWTVGAALAVAAPARFVFSAGYLGFLVYRALVGLPPPSPSFDEHTVMSAINLPVWPLLLAELLFLIWAGRKVHRALPEAGKWQNWACLITGTVAGFFLWLAYIGPILLQ